MNATKKNDLFSPVELGPTRLNHRVVMAPLTRSRSLQSDGIPGGLMLEYYSQRTSAGGLIITEAAQLSLATRGWHGAPGMYSDAHVDGWKKIVDAVHTKGGHIYAQLWHPGRFSHVTLTGGAAPVSASVDPEYWENPSRLVSTPIGWVQPSPHRALERSEIPGVVEEYAKAVARAKAAGFDGVEVHAGNGYLIDQFLQNGSNKRTDEYGGSIENRVRLLFEVVEAMVSAWANDRVGVRVTPSGTFNAMSDSDPEALHAHVAEGLNRFGLAYLHVIEPRMSGSVVIKEDQPPVATQRARKIFRGKIIANGGFEPDSAAKAVEQGDADAIAFGRHFISNPDLPRRIREKLPLAAYDRDTFYTFEAKGYTDYPFYEGELKPEPYCPIDTSVERTVA
jgi:N-ethylmaleimide reductase